MLHSSCIHKMKPFSEPPPTYAPGQPPRAMQADTAIPCALQLQDGMIMLVPPRATRKNIHCRRDKVPYQETLSHDVTSTVFVTAKYTRLLYPGSESSFLKQFTFQLIYIFCAKGFLPGVQVVWCRLIFYILRAGYTSRCIAWHKRCQIGRSGTLVISRGRLMGTSCDSFPF